MQGLSCDTNTNRDDLKGEYDFVLNKRNIEIDGDDRDRNTGDVINDFEALNNNRNTGGVINDFEALNNNNESMNNSVVDENENDDEIDDELNVLISNYKMSSWMECWGYNLFGQSEVSEQEGIKTKQINMFKKANTPIND